MFLIVICSTGCLYSNVKAPLDTNVTDTQLGSKVGVSSSQSWFWLFAWGDASTAAAAKEGGIEVIKHLDIQYQSMVFGLYIKTTTIAYGD